MHVRLKTECAHVFLTQHALNVGLHVFHRIFPECLLVHTQNATSHALTNIWPELLPYKWRFFAVGHGTCDVPLENVNVTLILKMIFDGWPSFLSTNIHRRAFKTFKASVLNNSLHHQNMIELRHGLTKTAHIAQDRTIM